MIIWKPKTLMGEWWDVGMYEALRQKKLASGAGPAQEEKSTRRSKWKTLEEGSPALDLLRFLDTFEREHGVMPSKTEIATGHFQTAPKSGYIPFCLSALENGGWIHREFGQARGITITPAGRMVLA